LLLDWLLDSAWSDRDSLLRHLSLLLFRKPLNVPLLDHFGDGLGSIALLHGELGYLELHEDGILVVLGSLVIDLEAVLLHEIGEVDDITEPFDEEVSHEVVLTVAADEELGILLVLGDLMEGQVRLLLEDEVELLLDLLVLVVEEAVVLALALEQLGQHQVLVVDVHIVLVLDAQLGIDGLVLLVFVVEQLLELSLRIELLL